MTISSSKSRWLPSCAALLGHLLEHYDIALYGLLAPFLAPLFFPSVDPVASLIYAYAIMPLGLFFRPLGALFFGFIGDHFGRKKALMASTGMMAVVTALMGCLPTWHQAGIWAPILLAITKTAQTFCVAGESAGGAVFLLEQVKQRQKSFFSSIYAMSSMIGVLLASSIVTYFALWKDTTWFWRIPFLIGGATLVASFVLRACTLSSTTLASTCKTKLLPGKALWGHRRAILAVAVATGFSYANYATAFTFMNGFLPLTTPLSSSTVLAINSLLLFVDMALLPIFGWLGGKIGKERLMMWSACGMAFLAIPLFASIAVESTGAIITMRALFMMLGVAFAAPMQAWAQELLPSTLRYTSLSLAVALGAQSLGTPASAIMLWSYHATGWLIAPAFYIAALALITWRIVATTKSTAPEPLTLP